MQCDNVVHAKYGNSTDVQRVEAIAQILQQIELDLKRIAMSYKWRERQNRR